LNNDVDSRDKPGHDEEGALISRRRLIGAALATHGLFMLGDPAAWYAAVPARR
jgi:hypothetical protein